MEQRLTVPAKPGDFSAEWFTTALTRDHPGAVVSGFEVLDETTGVTMRSRVRLRYAAGAGPHQVFVKSTVHEGQDPLFGAKEALLYACGESLPVELPRCYASAIDDVGRSVLVLEDLTRRGVRLNLAVEPFDPAMAASGLEGLAALHGRYWGGALREATGLEWVESFKYDLLRQVAPHWDGMVLDKAEKLGMIDLVPAGLRTADLFDSWWGLRSAPGPRTLVHGDPHTGNTYTLPDGTIGFLDWQLVSEDSWEHDVGYFLIGSLAVEDRRAHERELLEGYVAALRAAGGDAPDFDAAWARYRMTPIYGLLVWLITATNTTAHLQSVCDESTRRFAHAFEDLETERAWGR